MWLISLISGCLIRSKHGCFQQFFTFITLWLQSTGIWLISRYNQHWYSFKICQVLNWNLVNFLLISVTQTSTADILLSKVQISSKTLPLAFLFASKIGSPVCEITLSCAHKVKMQEGIVTVLQSRFYVLVGLGRIYGMFDLTCWVSLYDAIFQVWNYPVTENCFLNPFKVRLWVHGCHSPLIIIRRIALVYC